MDALFNMNHPEFHTDWWFEGMDFYTKLAEVLCDECERGDDEEEEPELC
jgi:hypothetical protein